MNANHTPDIEAIHAAELIHHKWDEALGRKDIEAALELYAPDAVLESPFGPSSAWRYRRCRAGP